MSHPANSLADASSSYLRSAMHQPIRWHEWGEAAFALATKEDKPILLDIGAVWCHWCHVMDRESYEDPAIAAIINEHFIAVKVDRDERPDVDSRYQIAVQSISGQGGWPLTAFLTPDGKPFFGGTYFPPDDRWGRPGFAHILNSIAKAFREKRDEVDESGAAVLEAISHQESFRGHSADVDPAVLTHMLASARKMYDRHNGGFGHQPKFPHSSALDLVIDAYVRTGSSDDELETIFSHTLTRMATGGVYDQLAGGFHRYSVDDKWIVPHFEKMSYDNSELLKNYVHAWQATRDPLFAAIARDIIRWTDEWLSDREHGGFYASQDADLSLDDDGDYFTWTRDEAAAILSPDEFDAAAAYYDIGPVGEMHHNPQKNVLFVSMGVEQAAKKSGHSEEDLLSLLGSAREKMLHARLSRPTPYIDKTIYIGWNSMMVSAYLEAARALNLDPVRRFALKSLDRILSESWDADAKRLGHVLAYSDPKAARRPLAGVLDDYAFTALACLDAYEATSDLTYFRFARAIADAMITRFHDPTGGGFFDMDSSADPALLLGALTATRKPLQDSPTPAGNPAAAIALLRLHALTDLAKYHDLAENTLECFAGVAAQFGIFAGTYGLALRRFTTPHTQAVILGSDAAADSLFAVATERYSVGLSVLRLRDPQPSAADLPPALAETIPNLPAFKEGAKSNIGTAGRENDFRSCAILCSNFTCQPPIFDPTALRSALQPRP